MSIISKIKEKPVRVSGRTSDKSSTKQVEKPAAAGARASKSEVTISGDDAKILRGEAVAQCPTIFGMEVWTPMHSLKLYCFVSDVLEQNPLFADRPYARETVAKKVCSAIEGSANLTAQFYQKIVGEKDTIA